MQPVTEYLVTPTPWQTVFLSASAVGCFELDARGRVCVCVPPCRGAKCVRAGFSPSGRPWSAASGAERGAAGTGLCSAAAVRTGRLLVARPCNSLVVGAAINWRRAGGRGERVKTKNQTGLRPFSLSSTHIPLLAFFSPSKTRISAKDTNGMTARLPLMPRARPIPPTPSTSPHQIGLGSRVG